MAQQVVLFVLRHWRGEKWVADKNIWACIFRYIHRILFLGEGQKGISDPAKGQFFRTNIGDSQ